MTQDQKDWHAAQCEQYRREYPIYKDFAVLLKQILEAACKDHAPSAIIQARSKGFANFAEKMARKAERYMLLNIGPTDLCGARVITETAEDAEKICALIRNNFTIDEENSLDARTRLKAAEFGYLAYHYVVQFKGANVFGIAVPKKIGNRKAEIQVKTLLEHAFASIAHDRFYKTSLVVRESLKRDMARAAALLEEADAAFGNCVRALGSYKLHYGTYMSRKRLEEEAEILQGFSQMSRWKRTSRRLLCVWRNSRGPRATTSRSHICCVPLPR